MAVTSARNGERYEVGLRDGRIVVGANYFRAMLCAQVLSSGRHSDVQIVVDES